MSKNSPDSILTNALEERDRKVKEANDAYQKAIAGVIEQRKTKFVSGLTELAKMLSEFPGDVRDKVLADSSVKESLQTIGLFAKHGKGKRQFTPEQREKISKAQKAAWAKRKATKGITSKVNAAMDAAS